MNLFDRVLDRLRSRLLRVRWRWLLAGRVSGRIKLRGDLRGLSIDPSFRCDGDLWLGIYNEGGRIDIGPEVNASGPLVITAIRGVEVGAGVLIGPNVMITDHYHGNPQDAEIFQVPPSARPLYTRGPISIGDFAQLGANVSVLSPAQIGRFTIVGANSVVTGILQSQSIYAGAPAKPLTTTSLRK